MHLKVMEKDGQHNKKSHSSKGNKNSKDDENQNLRETIDRSFHGAPAAGRAVRDRFSADEVYQRVVASGLEDIDRSLRLLFFSGVAAGLSIGVTLIGRATMTAAYPEDPTGLGNLLYPLGFIIIILGGQQLFTENTLTPVTLVQTRLASIPTLLRLWGIVLLGNLLGVAVPSFFLAKTGILEPDAAKAALSFGEHALNVSWWDLFHKGIIAGGLVASMVWLVHASRDTITRFFVVYIFTIAIPVADLFHCIIGACEMFYLVFRGVAGLYEVFANFFLPVLIGNTIGGVIFVAMVSYAMTGERRLPENSRPDLNIREWLFGRWGRGV